MPVLNKRSSLFTKYSPQKDNLAQGMISRIISVFGKLEIEDARSQKAVSVTDEARAYQPLAHMLGQEAAGGYGNLRRYVNFEESTKPTKLRIYRQMSEYPEIRYALNTIVDEIINHDDLTDDVAKLDIQNKRLLDNRNIRDNLHKEWDYIFHDVLNFNVEGWDTVYNYLVTGEIFYEKLIGRDGDTSKGLLGVRKLLADNTYVIYKQNGEIDHFELTSLGSHEKIAVSKEQIAYANWGSYAYNQDTGERIILSYLEPIKKVWRQLQLLEEAVVIYRIVRAPERRVFKIATGNMPRSQAEAYVQQLIRTYRQKKVYNLSTGEIDGQANILNMLEDYWFSEPENGNGSSVDTLPGGESLGEITDLDWFLGKLYRAMEIPISRRLDTNMGSQNFNAGQVDEITHQEVKFSKFTDRVTMKVKAVLFDIYKTHLRLKGLWDEYGLKDRDFKVQFFRNNYFEEMKRMKIEETRLNAWGTISSYVGEIISEEVAVKKYLKWSTEEWEENKQKLEMEKLEKGAEDTMGLGGGF